MTRNIILCADGTCNVFGKASSNVARLLDYLELQNAAAQVVCYDQGIGTRRSQHKDVAAFKDRLGQSGALRLLDPPDESEFLPWTWPSLFKSMTDGKGLDTNVRQLYETLAALYEPGDRVSLFGFSRGAFTVRALAGLTWRYGLPATGDVDQARARFAEAWPLFSTEFPDEDGVKAVKARRFRETYGQQACPIHFLGLWDTVKSYGGLRPVMLPHLRHNPSVATVRHAIALDERRGWFELTTWGWLDSDREDSAAASRLPSDELEAIRKQDVVEVWFSGCHSDVGGGGRNGSSSSIALRWMLGEARNNDLQLNAAGEKFLAIPSDQEKPQPTNSRTLLWSIIERKQRLAISNAGRWPATFAAKRGASPREPLKSARNSTIWHHESVTNLSRFGRVPDGVTLKPRATERVVPRT